MNISESQIQGRLWHLLVGGAFCLVIQGCSTTNAPVRPPATQRQAPPSNERGLDSQQLGRANHSCYGGIPVETRAAGATELIVRQGYVLEHSSADRIPLWVCESVSVDQLQGHLPRHNQFKADPDLKGPKSYPSDYARSGYDRGHQAPAGNQTQDAELKDETFYMSNMAP